MDDLKIPPAERSRMERSESGEEFVIKGDLLEWSWRIRLWDLINSWSDDELWLGEYEADTVAGAKVEKLIAFIHSVETENPVGAASKDEFDAMISFLKGAAQATDDVTIIL